MPKKLSSITLTSVICVLLTPVVIIGCFLLVRGKQYYLASAVIILLALAALFASLEKKKLQTRELVTIACIVALAVAGRAALFMLPQVKLTCAIVILAAISFGPDVGFLCGALSMLVSNVIFGQGAHTPFQMFGMGLVAFLCGVLFYKKKSARNRWLVAAVGGLLCFAVYGFIVDTSSVLFFAQSSDIKAILAVYASGVSFNLIHAATTFVTLAIFTPYIGETFERIAKKYELFGA